LFAHAAPKSIWTFLANFLMLPIFFLHRWPDTTDLAIMIGFAAVLLGLLTSGYVLLVLDIRAWLRAARRIMIVVRNYLPEIPAWARQKTPRCLLVFGLKLPCTEEQLLSAYRQKVKRLHPDKGGDRQKFMVLQSDFEQARHFLQSLEESVPAGKE
jgi:hypothetical protein